MIPPQIHYCWFGGAMNRKTKECLESWKRLCPAYEIICWNEKNAPLQDNNYVRQAFEAKKWAFVSDYVRLAVLCDQGGIYLDTDVELLKPLDILLRERGVIGFESDERIATCLMAAEPRHSFFYSAKAQYQDMQFIRQDGSYDYMTNTERMTELFLKMGLRQDNSQQKVCEVSIYPKDFFSPKDLKTGKICLTDNSLAIHHFQASWMPLQNRVNTKLAQMLGPDGTRRVKQWMGRG